MSRATRLANHIERTATGPMWHGPALLEVLKGVACDQALARPLPDAHTIWELVLHITAWCDIAAQRIKGNATGDPTPEQDWPPVPASLPTSGDAASDISPAAEWRLAIEQLVDSHRRLAGDIRQLDDAALDARVKGLDYPVGILLDGVVEHGTYHGGQIALLRKAVGAARSTPATA